MFNCVIDEITATAGPFCAAHCSADLWDWPEYDGEKAEDGGTSWRHPLIFRFSRRTFDSPVNLTSRRGTASSSTCVAGPCAGYSLALIYFFDGTSMHF
jgi:hypothetical protein